MIHHIVRVRFTADLSADLPLVWTARARALGDLACVQAVAAGAVAAIPRDGSECCAIFLLRDEAAYQSFLNDPGLQGLENWMWPVVSAVHIFDVYDPSDADLPRRLARIRMERAAPSP